MQKTSLCAFLSLVFAVSTVHAATAPMVDGVSNGVSTKYNQNCLDVAYKNAYEEADGKKTDSSTFPNYKCYKDGKEIYCNEVREDGQTENAKTDHFVNKLPDGLSCVGVPESQKVYEGSVVSCDDVAYKNGYCKASGVSPCDLSGFKCYQDRVATACSDVTDDAQNDKAEADYLEYQWQKINLNRLITAKLTVGKYENPSDATDTRYCRCMGKGKIESIKGTTNEDVSVPELISAFGEFTRTGAVQLYIFDEHIPSIKESNTVSIEITKPNGDIVNATLAYSYREESFGRKVYRLNGYPFGLADLVGQEVFMKVTW